MKRSALDALDALEILTVDSFLYVADGAGEEVDSGRPKRLDRADRAIDADAALTAGTERDAPDATAAIGGSKKALASELADHAAGGAGQGGPAIAELIAYVKGLVGDPADAKALLSDLSAPAESLASLVLEDYFSGSADGAAGYDIHIKFKGDAWTEELQQAFIQAADYFTTVITGDIGDSQGVIDGFVSRFVDDLRVTASLTSIDGVGGVLGQAGPLLAWTPEVLTSVGIMQFDTADALTLLDDGLWDDTVTHELMHVLGFGTLWNVGRDLVTTSSNISARTHWTPIGTSRATRRWRSSPSRMAAARERPAATGTRRHSKTS